MHLTRHVAILIIIGYTLQGREQDVLRKEFGVINMLKINLGLKCIEINRGKI